MAKPNSITMLSEILATALADRPDLDKRLSTLMGGRQQNPAQPVQGKISMAERRHSARKLFTTLSKKAHAQ